MLSRIATFFILLFGCLSVSSSQAPIATIDTRSPAFPMAIYSDIKVVDLNRLLIDSFLESGFSLLDAKKYDGGITAFRFSYPVDSSGKYGRVTLEFKLDGALVNKKCMNCFLRWPTIQGEDAIGKLPWMAQYDLSSRLYPDIDKAYFSIKNKSWNYIDQKHGFGYKNMWSGERNRSFVHKKSWSGEPRDSTYDNSYINISLPDLKREFTRAFTDAGFVLLRDRDPAADASLAVLEFSFPIDSDKPDGAVYLVQLASQFDATGLCYPCESIVFYDPHQKLPATGLSGMADRLTLASRFESSLDKAYDQIKASTQQYLRPRTQFVRPPKTAPLGSPRPPPLPVVVT